MRKPGCIEHSPFWELGKGILFCKALLSSAPTPYGCFTPSLPAWPLQVLECVTYPPHPGGTLRDLESPREQGITGKMGCREERRNPGILEVRFVPFTKLPASIQRFPWDWRESLRSPFTLCCSHSTEACAVMVGGKRHPGKEALS